MGIGQILFAGAKTVVNYVKKNPKKIALMGGAGGVGVFLLGKALTMKQDKAADFVNRSVLVNPVINPLGALRHILNPNDNNPNDFDTSLVKLFVNYNKQKYQTDRKTANAQVVKEFYENGGKGVRFE